MTEWFITDGTGVHVHAEDPSMLLVGNGPPDWIQLPDATPGGHAGKRLRVKACAIRPCIKCSKPVRHLALEEGFFVAECRPTGCGFLVYQLEPKESQNSTQGQSDGS